ncbi:MAG: hypothetical protein DLM69_03310 [Candidatus Chloroheliales bacterium]|nr:MAG: hypothetical protein DLM69_03310 [Chloroflexota bacterium]
MAHALTINGYLSPTGKPLGPAEQFRLLEIAIRAHDLVRDAVPGNSEFWCFINTVQQLGYDPEVIQEQGGLIAENYPIEPDRTLRAALYLLPGGATLYVAGEADAVLTRCTAAVGGPLLSIATVAAMKPPGGYLTALAILEMSSVPADLSRDRLEQQLTLVGFVVMEI